MRKQYVYNLCLGIVSLLAVSCADKNFQNVRSVNVIQPIIGQTCGYQIAPATLQTLDSLTEMRGRIGKVVHSKTNLEASDELLKSGIGFLPLDMQFNLDGNVAFPVDLTSLYGASLYYGIESSYLMFRNLEAKADLSVVVPNFADTTIVFNANSKSGSERKEVYDNAEFLAYRDKQNQASVKNYFFTYPNKDVKDIPLGLNMGVLAHEYTHMVFHHLFLEPGIQRGTLVSDRDGTRPTEQTLAAVDEGVSDYFGFLLTRDPAFLQCSFPLENRNLAVEKSFTEDIVLRLERKDDSFDPHEGGAVFAAIQYRIGEELKNHETNATNLIRMMAQLLECPEAKVDAQTLGFDFGDIAKCHLRQYTDGTQQATVRAVYERYLGFRYKGR